MDNALNLNVHRPNSGPPNARETENHMPRICLNMIVKNESAIIERALRSTIDAIDCYVICDTGSTDDTPQRIESLMDRHGIPGHIAYAPFHDFAQARNAALDAALNSDLDFDYLLLMDADMELVVDDLGFRDSLTEPIYSIRQEANLSYYNVRLVRRDTGARYIGVTHEYVGSSHPQVKLEAVWFQDHANGANRADKFERDIRLLSKDLERDPSNARSLFYLAQSYKDIGNNERAIEFYRRRVAAGGWDQEVWYAKYMIATCYRRMNDDLNFVQASFEAYDYRPSRAESLYHLAVHYRTKGLNEACAAICELGMAIPPTTDTLFVERDAYGGGFEREMSIAGFYSALPSRKEFGREACFRQTTSRAETPQWRWRSINNAVYFARQAKSVFGSFSTKLLRIPTEYGYVCMNPSIVIDGDKRHCIIRTVNYRSDDGRYTIMSDDQTINTINFVAELDANFEVVSHRIIDESNDPGPIFPGDIQGFEDCRPIWFRGRPWLTATTRNRNAHMLNEIALLELDDDWKVQGVHIQHSYEATEPQKNWMPFVRDDSIQFLYKMDPLTILKVDESTRQATPISISSPPMALFLFRGGSQLLKVDRGWMAVTHEVADSGKGSRIYLHRFVLLDEHMSLLAITEPFYFFRTGVEFCAGLAYDPEGKRFVVSFGVNDSEAWLGFLDESAVYDQLRYKV